MSDETRSVSATGGEKGTKLARYDLIPTEPLRAVAEHFGFGARKYADRNWERGYEWSKSYAALQRHANAFWGGQDLDECDLSCPADCVTHTNTPHLAAVIFHAMALLEWNATHPEFDDRPSTLAERTRERAQMRVELEQDLASEEPFRLPNCTVDGQQVEGVGKLLQFPPPPNRWHE